MQFSYISTECIYVSIFIVSKNLQRVFMLKRLNIKFFAKKYVFCFLNENLKNKHFLPLIRSLQSNTGGLQGILNRNKMAFSCSLDEDKPNTELF